MGPHADGLPETADQAVLRLRRELHAHPELAHREHGTAARIVEFLQPLAPDQLLTGVGGTGVVATFDSGRPGPVLLFRAELDALPIAESGVAGHASTNPGVSHKCGHDGHMAMLCGIAAHLSAHRPASGAVHLLFQPAEEVGQGAAAVLADPSFARIRPDFAVALHNMPGLPAHTLAVRPGVMTAAVTSLVIRLVGRSSHASEPEKGLNPSLAVADLLRACDGLNDPDAEPARFQLVTPIHVRIGSPAYGVSAGEAEVHLTLRSFDDGRLAALLAKVLSVAGELAERDGLAVAHERVESFAATVNDPAATEVVLRAAAAAGIEVMGAPGALRAGRLSAEAAAGALRAGSLSAEAAPGALRAGRLSAEAAVGALRAGSLSAEAAPGAMRAGEDFGLFTARFPCAFVLLGAGEAGAPLHSEGYDFPDDLLDTGVRLYEAIVAAAPARN